MIELRVVAVLLLTIAGSASADRRRAPRPAPPPAAPRPATAAPSGSAHDRLSVLDVKIGMSLDALPGYACTKDKRTASGDREDRHCVKFVDDRCKGQPQNIGKKRYGETAPKGCFHDTSNATYLDDLLMQDPHTGATDQPHNGRTPLLNVHVVGTESTPSKIYRISYTVARDDLSENSKLHKALVAKYGEPTEIHGWMRWKIDSTELKASCGSTECTIDVMDRRFEEMVEREQQEADARTKRATAPEPKL